MKKIFTILLTFFIIFTNIIICFAGDVPEGLLYNSTAQVYFGELKSIEGETLTVIQKKNVKGEFEEGKEYTYQEYINFSSVSGTKAEHLKVGETYLCGYYDDVNPLYVFITKGDDPKTLKIVNAYYISYDSMAARMQEYLNNGDFEKAEQERIEKLQAENIVVDTLAGINDNSENITKNVKWDLIICITILVVITGITIYFIKLKYMNKIFKNFAFWFLIIGLIVNIINLIGQDDKNIILIGLNPILNIFSGNANIREFMNSWAYLWNLASMLTNIFYGLILDFIRMNLCRKKEI